MQHSQPLQGIIANEDTCIYRRSKAVHVTQRFALRTQPHDVTFTRRAWEIVLSPNLVDGPARPCNAR